MIELPPLRISPRVTPLRSVLSGSPSPPPPPSHTPPLLGSAPFQQHLQRPGGVGPPEAGRCLWLKNPGGRGRGGEGKGQGAVAGRRRIT